MADMVALYEALFEVLKCRTLIISILALFSIEGSIMIYALVLNVVILSK